MKTKEDFEEFVKTAIVVGALNKKFKNDKEVQEK